MHRTEGMFRTGVGTKVGTAFGLEVCYSETFTIPRAAARWAAISRLERSSASRSYTLLMGIPRRAAAAFAGSPSSWTSVHTFSLFTSPIIALIWF
jgi:hypothetical protein